MNPHNEYSRTVAEREVPYSVIKRVYYEIKDKPPEEQDSIRTKWAKIIEATYPFSEGKGPNPCKNMNGLPDND